MKPRMSAKSLKWVCQIDSGVRDYDVRGKALFECAADTLDGYATRDDLDDLIRRRFLNLIKYNDNDDWGKILGSGTCGGTWSVRPTDKLLRTFWPDRLSA